MWVHLENLCFLYMLVGHFSTNLILISGSSHTKNSFLALLPCYNHKTSCSRILKLDEGFWQVSDSGWWGKICQFWYNLLRFASVDSVYKNDSESFISTFSMTLIHFSCS